MRTLTNKTVMHSYPGLVAVVTVSHNGKDNVMAAGWHTYISYEPPIYGVAIGRERYTYNLLKEAGSFAINFLPYERAGNIQLAGVYSGKETNKFEVGKMGFDRGITTEAPILHDSYIAYECKIMDVNSYGDHDWFVGEITRFYRDEDKFLQNGLPNFEKLEIPLYLGRSQYVKVNEKSEIRSFQIEE